jgi:hypothetical protein
MNRIPFERIIIHSSLDAQAIPAKLTFSPLLNDSLQRDQTQHQLLSCLPA